MSLFIRTTVIFIFIFISCSKNNENEPNDSPESAKIILVKNEQLSLIKANFNLTPLQTKNSNQFPGKIIDIYGSFQSREDRDCFHIKAMPGYFTVKLNSTKGINGAIEIIDPKTMKRIKFIDDHRKSDEETLSLNKSSFSTIFCFLQGERDKKKNAAKITYHGQYIYYRISMADEFFFENEPNDNMATANNFPFGKIIVGSYSPALNSSNDSADNFKREEDWYRFDYPRQNKDFFQFQLDLSPVGGADPVIVLYNARQSRIMTFDNNHAGEGERTPLLRLYPGESFYIRIFSKVINNLPHDFYSLRLLPQDKDNFEFEPNNSPAEANSLKQKTTGFLSHKGDADYFQFTVAESGKNLFAEIRFPKKIQNGYVEILNHEQSSLFISKSDVNLMASIAGFFLPQGIYYLKVADLMEAFSNKDPYSITMSLSNPEKQGEREPNNTIKTANPFTWNKHLKKIGPAYLVPENDKDYFLLKIRGNKRKRFRFELRSKSQNELELSIGDPMGFILKKAVKKPDENLVISETIDGKGYLIIQMKTMNKPEALTPYNLYIHEF